MDMKMNIDVHVEHESHHLKIRINTDYCKIVIISKRLAVA
jgi:hypothetical protein